MGNDEEALDATQEALIAIARGVSRFDGRSAFSTWAYRVATNAALDELRRRGRRPVPHAAEDDDAPPLAEIGAVVGAGTPRASDDPAGSVAARVDVDRALALLSPDHRAAVVLRDLLDLDYAEIAAVLDVPIGTVRSRIARGRAAVAESLRATEDDDHPGACGGNPAVGPVRPNTYRSDGDRSDRDRSDSEEP